MTNTGKTTAEIVVSELEKNPDLNLKNEGNGQYRLNSPLREGSDSHAFTLVINDGEHGGYKDHVTGDQGSLYDLATKLNIKKNGKLPPQKRDYTGLDDYALAHGVSPEVFKAAGWKQVTYIKRKALFYPTKTGDRYHFLDGAKPKNLPAKKGYRRCWYGLQQAVSLAKETKSPLVICNGEPSVIAGQHYRVPATAMTGGEKASLPDNLVKELQAVYTGPVLIALDCDKKGRRSAPALASQLSKAGYKARAVDLAMGLGQDLADYCKLHKQQSRELLAKLSTIKPAEAPQRDDKIKTAELITALNSLGYQFKMNILNDDVEVNGQPLSDTMAAEIRARMWDAGYTKYPRLMEDAYTMNAAKNGYHPVKDYLESLKYDGLPHINILASYFKDDRNVFTLWLKKWLVGSVARIYEQAQNPMLVLDGAQGEGKSYFAAWLCPLKKRYVESNVQPDNIDHKLLLAATWLWEVSELGATTKRTDRESLKAFITMQWITARKPYGKRPITKPAMASFIGTINDEAGFLNDPTGNRRFLTCTLTEIDWDYTAININDVWAEAYHLYKNGYKWRLTSDERKMQAEINDEYEIYDPWLETILTSYQVTGNIGDFQSSKDILTSLGADPTEKRYTMRLAQVLKKLESKGVKKARMGAIRGYTGIAL